MGGSLGTEFACEKQAHFTVDREHRECSSEMIDVPIARNGGLVIACRLLLDSLEKVVLRSDVVLVCLAIMVL